LYSFATLKRLTNRNRAKGAWKTVGGTLLLLLFVPVFLFSLCCAVFPVVVAVVVLAVLVLAVLVVGVIVIGTII
jgi:hypothetical protein